MKPPCFAETESFPTSTLPFAEGVVTLYRVSIGLHVGLCHMRRGSLTDAVVGFPASSALRMSRIVVLAVGQQAGADQVDEGPCLCAGELDRKSVVWGKSVYVRVYIG